jgi:outer membrane receptor protein involved in Fe transport
VNFGQDDYTTRVYVRGNAAWSTLDLIKIYIDGVEVARPVYLSTIDPSNIDRIEVVRGPQASTIYGSEAASGVMQIFTKKGRGGLSRPQLELKTSVGAIESDYTPDDVSTPLVSNLGLALSGGSDGFSYHVSTSYLSTGEWLRNYGSDNLGFMASLRTVQGPLTAEFSAQVSERTFQQALYPIFLRYPASPSCPNCGNPEAVNKRDYTFNQNTIGLNLTFVASPRWRHSLILGHDGNRADYHQPEPNLYSPADTFVSLFQSDQRRRSVRYNTAYDVSLSPAITGRFTAGADYWTFNALGSQGNFLLQASSPVKPSPWYTASFTNDDWWNAGYFGMAEVGFHDRLFLTLATRIEHNPNFGDEYGNAVSPKIGVSYVRDVGNAQVKLRAGYGEGTRPPPPDARVGTTTPQFGRIYIANPDIGPEEKTGWDAGIEMYWGNTASFGITRYDEDGENLIQAVAIDNSVSPSIYQYQNIGNVKSDGWELETKLNVGRLSLEANYAIADTEILELTEAAASGGLYEVGDRMWYAPKYSGGATLAARFWKGSAALNMSYVDDWVAQDLELLYDFIYGGDEWLGSSRAYLRGYPSIAKYNLRTEQAITDRFTLFMRVDNLSNRQEADFSNFFTAPGRTAVIGARLVY